MRRPLVILACFFVFTPPTRGDGPVNPDGIPYSDLGGLIFFRRGNQTATSLGGVLFPRKVSVTTHTPDGPVLTRFTFPAGSGSPAVPPFPQAAPAFLHVEIPEPNGLLYIDDELIRSHGTSRLLQSPLLPPGVARTLRLRAAFKVGDSLLIEDKQVQLRAGVSTAVKFDGRHAVSVPFGQDDAEQAPLPRREKH